MSLNPESSENNRSIKQLLAEGFREVGILIVVFGPLYATFDGGGSVLQKSLSVLGFILFGAAVFWAGVEMEVR